MNAILVDAIRTPRGRGKPHKGSLSGVHPQELLAQVFAALAARAPGVVPAHVEDVILGCVSQVGEQGANVARNGVLAAGWPIEIPATTVNRFCSSGQQAVHFAAQAIAAGAADLVVAGGVESMSRVPMGSDGGGQDGGNRRLRGRFFQVPQGISADLIASREGLSRADVDAWAVESQRRAGRAVAAAHGAASLVAVRDPATGQVLLDRDESVRAETTPEALAALPPSFAALGATLAGDAGETLDELALRAAPGLGAIRHVHTAGNSSGLADGAAAVLVASEAAVRRHGLRPRARVRAVAAVGSDPVLMLTGPAPAARKALAAARMSAADIDLWEINEAFAAVVLQTIRALEIDPARVNVDGGAIALGHPLGATGAMLIGTALDALERRGAGTALVTMCIGGGQGLATVLERLS
jgi:acetyl-CoA C-acetyltransferase